MPSTALLLLLLESLGPHVTESVDAPMRALTVASRPSPTPWGDSLEPGEPGPGSSSEPGPVAWEPGEPATRASRKLFALAQSIDENRTRTVYSHRTKVRRSQGIYEWDCSGMINWMLERVATKAYATLDRERPIAASYVRVILAAPSSGSRGGWQQIPDIEEVEPGDLFAWRRPADWPTGGNSGHVGLVIAKPAKVAHIRNAYVVRVIDSTRWQHQDDTRTADETGFGSGTILFMTDDDRHPIGYGWFGSESGGYYETDVVFGRVH